MTKRFSLKEVSGQYNLGVKDYRYGNVTGLFFSCKNISLDKD